MEEIICPEQKQLTLLNLFQKNSERIESTFAITLSIRGNKIMFDGKPANIKKFNQFTNQMIELYSENSNFNSYDFKMSLSMVQEGKTNTLRTELSKKTKLTVNGKEVYPKTYNQKLYMNAITNNDLVFGIGPAGTGKTFLAIAMALNHLLSKKVDRIVLTRPVVEAGEKLGFLPGDIQQKVNPYFRPLYDSLYHLIGFEKTSELIEKEIIEIAPLAYMRGRTIDRAFIILDEGQNTSNSQIKMFLTRFGKNSKIIITADLSQIDLPDPKRSGIFRAVNILRQISGIKIINLNQRDVVRHPLVQKIIDAYQSEDKNGI